MTTFVTYQASAVAPFQFQAALDGQTYNITVAWNVYAQRWYLVIVDQSGNRIATLPRTGSPPNHDINIVGGYFQSTLVWRPSSGQFEISP